MSEARQPLSRVVVVGAGQVGVLAAIAVKRAVPRCDVTIVAHQGDVRNFADQASSGLPFSNRFHQRLGIEEEAIVARAGGSHRLVERFFSWGGDGQHGALSYGDNASSGAAAFGRNWGGGSRSSEAQAQPDTLAEVLADAGRFRVPGPREATPLAQVDYALRWNPAAYLRLLIDRAQRMGVQYRDAPLADVDTAESGVSALVLASGERLSADLFLDCSGVARIVHSRLSHGAPVPWEEAPETQAILLAEPGQGMIALEDRLSLTAHGWLREFAGRDGLQQILGLAPGFSAGQAAEALGIAAGTQIAVQSAHIEEPWHGNVVALGDAMAQFIPIGFYHADLAHRMIALLLELLPGATIEPTERAEFNRRAALMIEGVRHVLALHFAAPEARSIFPGHSPPPRIASTVDQFTRRGRLPFLDEQALTGAEKQGLMRALGFAEGIPPQHRGRSEQAGEATRRQFVAEARAVLSSTPPYAEWLTGQLPS